MNKPGILIAPTEPPQLKALGRSSSIPEQFGVDVYLPSLRCGIQRKAFSDLVASLTGDRLAKEALQMRRLEKKVLIVEGRPAWSADGEWIHGFQRFTLNQYWGLMLSVQSAGILVLHTRDIAETVLAIKQVASWAGKKTHTSLSTRTLVSKWGTKDSRDFQLWALQGFEGIGAVQAKAMVERFGGAPLAWTVTAEELAEVSWETGKGKRRRLGKVRAEKLLRALGPSNGRA